MTEKSTASSKSDAPAAEPGAMTFTPASFGVRDQDNVLRQAPSENFTDWNGGEPYKTRVEHGTPACFGVRNADGEPGTSPIENFSDWPMMSHEDLVAVGMSPEQLPAPPVGR